MRASASESQIHQGGLQQQLDSLSSAVGEHLPKIQHLPKCKTEILSQLSRLQGSLNDSGPSVSEPVLPPASPRKTWSAPNKDPFGGDLQVRHPHILQ